MLKINYPQFPKKAMKLGNDFGTAIVNVVGNDGDRITLPEQQETNAEEKVLLDVDLGGGRRFHHDIF